MWVFGTAADGDRLLYDADLKGPAAIVIGSEGDGMGRLVAETCDFKVRIPMRGSSTPSTLPRRRPSCSMRPCGREWNKRDGKAAASMAARASKLCKAGENHVQGPGRRTEYRYARRGDVLPGGDSGGVRRRRGQAAVEGGHHPLSGDAPFPAHGAVSRRAARAGQGGVFPGGPAGGPPRSAASTGAGGAARRTGTRCWSSPVRRGRHRTTPLPRVSTACFRRRTTTPDTCLRRRARRTTRRCAGRRSTSPAPTRRSRRRSSGSAAPAASRPRPGSACGGAGPAVRQGPQVHGGTLGAGVPAASARPLPDPGAVPLPGRAHPGVAGACPGGYPGAAMLLGLDVLMRGLFRLLRLELGMDTLLVFAAAATLADALTMYRLDPRDGQMPYCAAIVLGIFFLLRGARRKRRGLRMACRTAASAAQPYLVTLDEGKWNGWDTYAKWSGSPSASVARCRPPTGRSGSSTGSARCCSSRAFCSVWWPPSAGARRNGCSGACPPCSPPAPPCPGRCASPCRG